MKTKYIRLLSYENAMLVIDFINKQTDGYAYITMGGVGVQLYGSDNWEIFDSFIISLNVRYEITDEHPYKVNQKIVENLKANHIID